MTGLKALERIKKSHYIAIAVMGCERDYETENAIESVEKSLKALEIIKSKNVDVDYFLFWIKQDNLGKVEDYNQLLKHENGRCQRLQLTEEEFNILKEMLE